MTTDFSFQIAQRSCIRRRGDAESCRSIPLSATFVTPSLSTRPPSQRGLEMINLNLLKKFRLSVKAGTEPFPLLMVAMEMLRLELSKLRRQVTLALGHDRFYFVVGAVALTVILRKWLRERNKDRAINRFLREIMARKGQRAKTGRGSSPLHSSMSSAELSQGHGHHAGRVRTSRSVASFLAPVPRSRSSTAIKRNTSIRRLQKLLHTTGEPLCPECFSRTSR